MACCLKCKKKFLFKQPRYNLLLSPYNFVDNLGDEHVRYAVKLEEVEKVEKRRNKYTMLHSIPIPLKIFNDLE